MEIITLCLRILEFGLQVVDLEVLLRHFLGVSALHSLLLALETIKVLLRFDVIGYSICSIGLHYPSHRIHLRWLGHGPLTAQCCVIIERSLQA